MIPFQKLQPIGDGQLVRPQQVISEIKWLF